MVAQWLIFAGVAGKGRGLTGARLGEQENELAKGVSAGCSIPSSSILRKGLGRTLASLSEPVIHHVSCLSEDTHDGLSLEGGVFTFHRQALVEPRVVGGEQSCSNQRVSRGISWNFPPSSSHIRAPVGLWAARLFLALGAL